MQLWVQVLVATIGTLGVVATAVVAARSRNREQLWVELRFLRQRQDELEERLDESRRSYLQLLGRHRELEAEHRTLKAEHAELLGKYEQVRLELDAIHDTGS